MLLQSYSKCKQRDWDIVLIESVSLNPRRRESLQTRQQAKNQGGRVWEGAAIWGNVWMFRPQDLPEWEMSPGFPIPATEVPTGLICMTQEQVSSFSTFNTINP